MAAKKAHGKNFSFFGSESFFGVLNELDDADVDRLIGPIVTMRDCRDLAPEVVKEVVDRIANGFALSFPEGPPAPVPPNKIEINRIPPSHACELKQGLLGHPQVEAMVGGSADRTLSARLSAAFEQKYDGLRRQCLTPGAIVDALYDFAIGGGSDTSERRAAAWSVLAYLFERCLIFEDKPREDAA